MTTNFPRLSLQWLLGIDAATCIGMGLLLALTAAPIAALTALPAPLLFWAGVLLFPIGVFMAVFAGAAAVPTWAARVVVAGNALWVLGSLALPVMGMVAPNAFGWAFLLMQALVVALLAWLEWGAASFRQRFA